MALAKSFRELEVYKLALSESKKIFLLSKIFQRMKDTRSQIKFEDRHAPSTPCSPKLGREGSIKRPL